MKKLPIGIQTFEKIIKGNYYYVDKTMFVHRLARTGDYHFLSRPRRFGKSLFLSTIKSAYQGRKDLFQGLYLENNWDWSRTSPVVHISFGSGVCRSIEELQSTFSYCLDDEAQDHQISYAYEDLKNRFSQLIKTLHDKYEQKVVVLIDEYDKPILDNIEHSERAATIRDELKNYYSVIKDADPYIEFVFITGVSKFSKVSLFSGLNNLEDITINPDYSAICGYTQQDLETIFKSLLKEVDLEQVKLWYNGYNWLGEEVYNPFDILLYLKTKDLRPYWFETGTPSFLVRLLKEGQYNISSLQNMSAGEEIVGSFDVDSITVEALLFQTGYLTIKGFEQTQAFRNYHLDYPNMEVRSSLTNAILSDLSKDRIAKTRNQAQLLRILDTADLDGLKDIFHAFFASIPHDWYRKNQLSGYEGYYASIFYCYFAALGLEVIPEDVTSTGRIDLTVKLEDKVFIFEFKVEGLDNTPGKALDQIRNKGYADKYRKPGKIIYLIGVEFAPETRNIVGFEWDRDGNDGH